MTDNRNMILAIVLSLAVLFGWQFFVAGPQIERAQQQAEIARQLEEQPDAGLPTPALGTTPGAVTPEVPSAAASFADRDAAIAAGPRVRIDSTGLLGSINLTGGRLDDLELKRYHETVDDSSPIISLLTPAGAPAAYFVEQGWVPAGTQLSVPDAQSVWTVEGANQTLTEATPVTIAFDNGEGLVFRRTFAIDENYLFTVTQSVENQGTGDVALFPYSRVARHGTPPVANFFILHEGPLGVLGSRNLIEMSYSDLANDQQVDVESTGGWLGFTDKYWAAAILPEPGAPISARFSYTRPGSLEVYQSSFVGRDPVVVAPGATGEHLSYVFAGAKVEAIIDNYEQGYGFDRMELLIDWGWFHFITKPMFYLIRILYDVLGNFGLAILAVTVIIKGVFFPLANRSYASMAAMRRVAPEMKAIQERHKDDRMAQQQAMMELYKKEKINPLSGCWPILVQIPVFFALYKVLFVTIEMRHAPFFGWIQDLAAPDPLYIFNLFGLLPYDPTVVPVIGPFLAIGIWPVIMGITMWVQMKLNPPPPDPTQAMIFSLMPVLFTFMLGTFPAGLVIYWAWNNFLSICQQWVIMKRHGVEVNLFGNILSSFKRKPKAAE
ncbi:membrane protein insertase YidC [Arsenicitalea aurantiaca]|uniref:Membrane protein insertase YidC n=1 Tax=Arsenicitalea aurantiaca TaxID=1783274 RepID=A0A433X2A7_9HYPH|nr:membrane protein insertase YidC [Arsenicitalea aurantiaca]RUT28229.1 membrane protein insertase YidC [Arsenicitalea aurantiaca]